MKTGAPAASGATPRTAVTKRRKTALSLPSPFGTTSSRTRPSADIQVFFSSGGSVSMLIRSASRRRLAWRSVVLNGAIRACWASSRAAGGAFTSGASTLARRRACTAAGLSKSRATSLKSALARRRVCAASASSTTSLPITAWVSAGVGSAPTSLGLRVFCRKKLASSIRASLASCSSGTKLCSVSTRPTSGNWRSFSAVAEAWARSLLSTSIVFGLVSGPFIRSSNVTTDSASCARRLSGLKSKRKPASSGKPRIVAASVVPTIQLRRFSRKRSRNASAAKPIGFCSAGGLSTVSNAGNRGNASAGDQAKVGKSGIRGREEGEECGRDRSGCQQERRRHPACRPQKCGLEVTGRMPLGSVADAELDAEINAEANEENREGDRDKVQRSYHPQADSGCVEQSEDEIHNNSE